jgi:hypothetical protein
MIVNPPPAAAAHAVGNMNNMLLPPPVNALADPRLVPDLRVGRFPDWPPDHVLALFVLAFDHVRVVHHLDDLLDAVPLQHDA